ncbi:MAG: hypothetical protein V4616_07395 [Bacteroidota bacterium]
MPKFLVGLVFLLFSSVLSAQVDVVYVYGYVKDDNTGLKMADVKLSVVQDGKVITTYTTSAPGKFEVDVPFDGDYELRFSKDGYVAKFIKMDTRNVPKDDKVGGFGFDLDISLFKVIEGVNFDLFKQPMGIAKYSVATGTVEFDTEYTKAFLAKWEALKKSYQNKVKADEDKLKQEQLAAEKEKQKQLKFEQAVKDGDAALAAANFNNAIFKYTEALDLIPGTKYVEEKLAAAKKAQDDANTLKQKEVLYKEAIAAADKAFTEKNYKNAVAEYNKALNHKPTENYPKTRIKEAEDLMANLAKQTALDAQYKGAINKADSAFKSNKFDQAITSYEYALALKPGEAYPQQKIGESKAKLEELANQKALDDRYKAAVALGDKAFTEKRYEDAIKSFQEAGGIKPAEAYPKTKIAEATEKLDALAKQRSQDEQYKNLVNQGDQSMAAAGFTAAIDSYTKASALKPAEVYPKNKIAEAKAKLAENSKKEAADKQYADLVAKGDQQITAQDWQNAVTTFNQAAALKPTEQHPKDQLVIAKRGLDELAKLKDIEAKYKAAVAKGDLAFSSKQYTQALLAFNEAKALKASEHYPITKIEETQKLLDDLSLQKQKDTEFKGYVIKGDSLFKAGKFLDAISYYEQAQKVKPEDVYPKNRITESNDKLGALEKQKRLDEEYAALTGSGDNLLKQTKYDEAIAEYKKASALKPAEIYPKNKITEAQGKLADIAKSEAADKQYADLVKKADDLLAAKDWQAALTGYQQASAIKPAEVYPKEKATLAKTELDKITREKAIDGQYNGLITKADASFNAKQFNEAIKVYQQASGLRPDEVYPKDRIRSAEEAMADLASKKETDQKYAGLISKADSSFKAAKYEGAIALYTQAGEVKPAETYPKTKIAEANTKLDELGKKKALDEQYKNLLSKADADFTAASYESAIGVYKEASALKPLEAYPKTKITEAQGKLADIAKGKARDEQYTMLITSGDSLFGKDNYTGAITKFQAASTLKPTEQYPKDKLAEAKGKLDGLNKQLALEEQYKGIVAKADVSFAASKWSESVGLYEQALKLKPEEAYPKERIANANTRLAELAKQKQDQEEAYKKAIALGDEAFTAADYLSAKTAFQQALGIKATEAYPKQKIAEADAKLAALAKQDQLNKQYTDLVAKADNSFKAEDFAIAITTYQQASALKPTEQYPKDKIAEANAKLAELKKEQAEDAQYKTLITKADADFTAMSFEGALKGYEGALALKPTEQYPKDRIETTKIRIDELNAARLKDKTYKDAVALGDASFTAKNYAEAVSNYQSALDVKPAEVYPQERIKMANAELFKLGKAKETDEKYKGLITKADTEFGSQKWTESIAAYKEAQAVKPAETYPATKIKEAEVKLAEIEKQRQLRDAKYAGLISKADSAFKKTSYQVAKNYYSEAIRVKPQEQYPKDQMDAADKKLDELARVEAEKKAQSELAKLNEPVVAQPAADPTINTFVDPTSMNGMNKETPKPVKEEVKPAGPKVAMQTKAVDDLDAFRRKLGENYPEGKTEESYVEGGKKYFRTIYVKDKMGDDYIKIVFPGSMGTFYLKNGSTLETNGVEFDNILKALN